MVFPQSGLYYSQGGPSLVVSPQSGLYYNQGGPSSVVSPQSGLYYNQGGPSQWSLLGVVFIIIRVVPHSGLSSEWSLL